MKSEININGTIKASHNPGPWDIRTHKLIGGSKGDRD